MLCIVGFPVEQRHMTSLLVMFYLLSAQVPIWSMLHGMLLCKQWCQSSLKLVAQFQPLYRLCRYVLPIAFSSKRCKLIHDLSSAVSSPLGLAIGRKVATAFTALL